jgi:drug/metabolite transporter (DMT)-like permease
MQSTDPSRPSQTGVRVAAPGAALSGVAGRLPESVLAWYFVVVWGSGFIATKAGLQYAAPFTFLCLRYAFGVLCMIPVAIVLRPAWPGSRVELPHVLVAGLLMHALNLGGSHYAQYLGLSAGIVALILSTQPLLTALIAARWMRESLRRMQWLGIAIGLGGVALIVWHKVDVRAMSGTSLFAVSFSLVSITVGALYQRKFCPTVDLHSTALLQFASSLVVLAPLSWAFEGMRVQWSWTLAGSVAFLVIFASVLALNTLHLLMRRGQATRVTSLMYLTPMIAVALEFVAFGVVPTPLSAAGIFVTCVGVALVFWPRR